MFWVVGWRLEVLRQAFWGEYLGSMVDVCGPWTVLGDYFGGLRVMGQRQSHRVAAPLLV